MRMTTTENVAFGVSDVEAAADYYKSVMGFDETDRQNDWIELTSGVLKIYVCPDDGHSPCFNLIVEDIAEAESRLSNAGGEVYMRTDKEVFVRDLYGHCFCLSMAP